jgi:hypothetical protein
LDPQSTTPGGGTHVPPPDPNLVLVLNLLVFGAAGYWILGQKQKAVIATVLWVAGLATCGVVSGLVAAVAAYDGYQQANRLRAASSNGS